MGCTRIDEVREPQLADIPEALQRGSIEERSYEILHFYIPMDWVLDDFHRIH
jgi:hypothetical protein